MSIKEKFESHPAVFGLSLLTLGFISGFGASSTINAKLGSPTIVENRQCSVKGADILAEAHHLRLVAIQKELVRLEGKASDDSIASYDQRTYLESAGRIRNDIALENKNFSEAIADLNVICK